jgi:alpha-glucosidase
MQRLGAAVWTGDINPSWDDLRNTAGYLLNWGLSGMPYVTCDIGGFTGQTNAQLLARWYQLGVFLPVMRVHSTKDATPHFPFFWPSIEDNLRNSLNLRYRLVPFLYSLAHRLHDTGMLSMRPMLADYWADTATHDMTNQWMVGDSLLAAPVMTEDNTAWAYLPQDSGNWYEWNSSTTHPAGSNLTLSNVDMDAIPVYVREGGIVPLGPVVQYTDALPGDGILTVHVYAGADGSFTLVEDDGETQDYTSGATRRTAFTWDDSTGMLKWTVSGSWSGSTAFTQVEAIVFRPDGIAHSSPEPIGSGGSIHA